MCVSKALERIGEAAKSVLGPKSILGSTPFIGIISNLFNQFFQTIAGFWLNVLDLVPECATQLEQQFDTFTETYEINFNYRMADLAEVKAKVAELEKEYL